MQIIRKIFAVSYSAIIVLFICCGLALIFFAALELWHGLNPSEALPLRSRFNFIVEGIGLLTIAVVALELGQTILDSPRIVSMLRKMKSVRRMSAPIVLVTLDIEPAGQRRSGLQGESTKYLRLLFDD